MSGMCGRNLPTFRDVLTHVYHRVKISEFLTEFFSPSVARQALVDHGLLIAEASQSHLYTPHLIGVLWMSDKPVAETSTWQHITLTKRQTFMHLAGFEP